MNTSINFLSFNFEFYGITKGASRRTLSGRALAGPSAIGRELVGCARDRLISLIYCVTASLRDTIRNTQYASSPYQLVS